MRFPHLEYAHEEEVVQPLIRIVDAQLLEGVRVRVRVGVGVGVRGRGRG